MNRRLWILGFLGLALFASSMLASRAGAIEPAREFLDRLRANGYYDMALEYLDRLPDSKLVPVELKEVILYERGVTLIEGSGEQRDMGLRAKQLDEAQQALEQFLQNRPQHPLAQSAKSQLGNLLQKRASMLIEQADAPGAQKSELLAEARGMYEEAYKVFEQATEDLKGKLASRKKVYDPKTEKEEIEARDQERRDYLQAQLLAAAIKEEMAKTVSENSDDHNKLLQEAADAYGDIYEKYRTRLAGLYARMYQGRCYQQMGKLVDALSYYAELLEQPDSPDAFRKLKTKTLALAMQCWMDDEQQKYAEAAARGSEWTGKARGVEERDPEWLQLKLDTARAHQLYAEQLRESKPNDPTIKRSLTEARKLATEVARYPGDLEQEARRILAELRGGELPEEETPDPTNFAEAKQAGKEALDSLQTAGVVMQMIPKRLQEEKDEAVKAELQKQIDEAQETLKTARDDARRYFELALKFADQETPLDDLNVVRYFLCYLYYVDQDFYDAAVMGEFLCRRYPESSGARQSAKIAMASFLKLYADNQGPDKSFEVEQTMGIAEYIAATWPSEPEAVDALNTLIPFAIQKGDLLVALEHLQKIPESSPKRGESELKTGQALWSAYLRGSSELREAADADPARQQELETLKQQAQQTLADGIRRMQGRVQQGEAIDAVLATAVLSLAQIYVDTEQADKAVALLEGEPIQLLELVDENHPATRKEGLAQETYKTALRAYIASLAASPENTELIGKARGVMDSLKKLVGTTPDGQRRLVAIYISLAHDLKKQIDLVDSAAGKKTLSEGFAAFLEQVGGDSDELNVLNWVAETFSGMGEAFETGPNPSLADARAYYGKAADTYARILEEGGKRDGWLDPKMKMQVQMRHAMTLRQMGQFNAAMDIFEAMLKEKPTMLDVQVEAALTYQQWAEAPEKEELYRRAIQGGREDAKSGKPTVMGWNRLSRLVYQYPKFRDTYHEARYNMALCNYSYALRLKSSDDKKKYLGYAKDGIEYIQKLHPDMGGAEWYAKYDALLRRVQRELGEAVVGLGGTTASAG